jgi:chromosome segregation ATPase
VLDQKNEALSSRVDQSTPNGRDTVFDWLVRRAEADLGIAHSLAAADVQKADKIRDLETALVGQINRLQSQITDTREGEINDLRSKIHACADRMSGLERAQTTAEETKRILQEFGDLRSQITSRQTEIESHYSAFEKIGESLRAQICSLEEELRTNIDGIRTTQAETQHVHSETQSLAARVAHAESAAWQTRTLVLDNSKQIEKTAESVTSEITELKAQIHKLHDEWRDRRFPETFPQVLADELSSKIEGLQNRLADAQNSRLDGGVRLEKIESSLTALGERIATAESLYKQITGLTQTEANSVLEFGENTKEELAGLWKHLDGPWLQQMIQDLEVSLRNKAEAWQHQATERLMVLEGRDAEREERGRQLAASLTAKLTEHEKRTDEAVRTLANGHEHLQRLLPELQALGQHIVDVETAIRERQGQVEAMAQATVQLEARLANEISAINGEIAKIVEQQRSFHLPEDQLSEIERKLGVKVDELERNLSIEREGFDHWGTGVRESFGAELSAVQARLSDRQSQIEHRYLQLERWQETVKASLDGLRLQLKEHLPSCGQHEQEWRRLDSDLSALTDRTSQLERCAREAEHRDTALTRDGAQRLALLQRDISDLKEAFDQSSRWHSDSIQNPTDKRIAAALRETEERLTRQLSQYNSAHNERERELKELLNSVQHELPVLRTAVEQCQNDARSMPAVVPAIEELMRARIPELEQKIIERISQIESCEAEREERWSGLFDTLQNQVANLQSVVHQPTDTVDGLALRRIEESFATQMQDLQQHMAQKLILFQNRDLERIERAEQAIASVKAQMAALGGESVQGRAAISQANVALRAMEENVNSRIEELQQRVGQKFSMLESRKTEVNDLKQQCQSLTERVTQLNAAIQVPQNTATSPVQTIVPAPPVSARPVPTVLLKGDNLSELQAKSEKEQLIKLQERMSAEIERVRAELKERSGRWKVRKSAS